MLQFNSISKIKVGMDRSNLNLHPISISYSAETPISTSIKLVQLLYLCYHLKDQRSSNFNSDRTQTLELCIKRPRNSEFSFLHQRWVDDLEFASCLLPAATGSSASKSLIRIFIFSFGSLFFSLYLSSWRWGEWKSIEKYIAKCRWRGVQNKHKTVQVVRMSPC